MSTSPGERLLRSWRQLAVPLVGRVDDVVPDSAERTKRETMLAAVATHLLATRGAQFADEIWQLIQDFQVASVFEQFSRRDVRNVLSLVKGAPIAEAALRRALDRALKIHQQGWQTAHWTEDWDEFHEQYRIARSFLGRDLAFAFWRGTKAPDIPRGNPLKKRNHLLRTQLAARKVPRAQIAQILRGIGFTSHP